MDGMVKLKAQLRLLHVGVPVTQLEEKYRVIYVEPEISVATQRMDAALAKLDLSKLMPILMPYLAGDTLWAIRQTVMQMRELFEVGLEAEVYESSKVSAMVSQLTGPNGKKHRWRLAVNTANLRPVPIEYLIASVAHEVWHAYQDERATNWWVNGQRRDLSEKELTYDAKCALNLAYVISPTEDESMYRNQLIEEEAYLLFDKVGDVIDRILFESYHAGKVPKQLLGAAFSPIGSACGMC